MTTLQPASVFENCMNHFFGKWFSMFLRLLGCASLTSDPQHVTFNFKIPVVSVNCEEDYWTAWAFLEPKESLKIASTISY
jgi:hypothetical protein